MVLDPYDQAVLHTSLFHIFHSIIIILFVQSITHCNTHSKHQKPRLRKSKTPRLR